MHNETEQEHIEANAVDRYKRQNPPQLPQIFISSKNELGEVVLQLLHDLTKSYEYYSACNKPEVEWDEYDHMMNPIWMRLAEFLGDTE